MGVGLSEESSGDGDDGDDGDDDGGGMVFEKVAGDAFSSSG